MKPAARIERECWIVSQLFEGYGGYIYEVTYRWSGYVLFCFAFIGEKWPGEDDFETVRDMADGIYWLRNYGKDRPVWERYLQTK